MKNSLILPVVVVLLLVLFLRTKLGGTKDTKSYLGTTKLGDGSPAPLSVKNNNPGNIIKSNVNWKGKVPLSENTDSRFEQFTSWAYGLRAMLKNMKTWHGRGKNTIRSLVATWAPAGDKDNDPSAYADFVERSSGISGHSPFVWNKDTVRKISKAMAHMEAGHPVVDDSDFDAAWAIM